MIKCICFLLILVDCFYCYFSVFGMCKLEEVNIYGVNDVEVLKGNGKLFYLYLFYIFY